jgi:molecular chaperone GrpE
MTQLDTQIQSIQEALAALEKQIARAGREQFKANALSETQTEQLSQALAQLQQAQAQRAASEALLHDNQQREIANARLEVARKIIPALDGIDAAIHSGQQMLDQQASQRLLQQLLQLQNETSEQEITRLRAMLQAWLQGLGFVRRRLLDAMATEGITPILSIGQTFDPSQHVAMEVVYSDTLAPGMVAHELRRGYQSTTQILRHAEVAVVGTQAQKETTA